MTNWKTIVNAWLIAIAMIGQAGAVGIDADCAALAARTWSTRGGLLGARIGTSVERTDRHETDSGAAFYAVHMTGGGTVITSADSEENPIIAFADGTNVLAVAGENTPLRALLNRRFAKRTGNMPKLALANAAATTAEPTLSAAARRWASLTNAPRQVVMPTASYIDGIENVVGDLRVPALTRSKWNQGYGPGGPKCWNYYTPNGYLCGCVATAMAQIMYFHRWPTANMPQREYKCYVDRTPVYLSMKGGLYNWSAMVDTPTRKNFTAETSAVIGEAIGRLTYDCGVSVRMSYYNSASAAYDHYSVNQFKNLFGYASATYFDCYNGENRGYGNSALLLTNNLERVILANLDAGCPVMLGIDGTTGGHEIVGDGYGYNDGLAYVHLNIGFGGGTDFWYLLPDMNGSENSNFSMVDNVIYNIIPGEQSNLAVFSGRVTDDRGNGVSNAVVHIREVRGGQTVELKTVSCNAYGVYGVSFESKADATYYAAVTNVAGYGVSQSAAVTVSAPNVKTEDMGYDEDIERLVFKGEDVGNSWGNDIVLKPMSESGDEPADDGLDIRVDALVKSAWDQLYAGGNILFGQKCYNYYTPNEMHCGCVPTALAQVMRYHEWPKIAVAANTYSCKVYDKASTNELGLVTTNLTMIGGVYDWSKMPYTTQRLNNPDEQMEMIGRVCYDIGVSMSASFLKGMTSAGAYAAIHTFPENFHYASAEAIYWSLSSNMTEYDEKLLQKMIVPSLDAGLPCVLAINGDVGGHSVVCDGYGFEKGELRLHINGGYSGVSDGWYSPTNMTIYGNHYYCINGANFNISPTNTGAIASGRVLDAAGKPVANAWMTIRLNGTTHKTMYTNAKGIYYFWGNPGTYDVIASKGGVVRSTKATLGKNISIDVGRDGSYTYPLGAVAIGNSPWNDIILISSDAKVAKPVSSVPTQTSFTGSLNVTLSCATDGATIHYTTDGSAPNAQSPVYTDAIVLTESTTIRAVAIKSGLLNSTIATLVYIEATLGDAIECPQLPWKTGGAGSWTVRTASDGEGETFDGVDSLRSPQYPVGQAKDSKTWLQTEIKGPATITFKYKYDPFYYAPFYVELDGSTNGQFYVSKSSVYNPQWQDGTVTIPEGKHVLKFEYWYKWIYKQHEGFDGVHLDQVKYVYTGTDPGDEEEETPELQPDPEPDDPVMPPDDPPDDPDEPEPHTPAVVTNHVPVAVTLNFMMTADNVMKVLYNVSTNDVAYTWTGEEFTFTDAGTDCNLWRGAGNRNIESGVPLVKNFGGYWGGYPVPNTNLEAGDYGDKYWQIDIPFDLQGDFAITNWLPKVFITNNGGATDKQPTSNNKQFDVSLSCLSAAKGVLSSAVVRSDKLGSTLVNTTAGTYSTTLSNGFLRIRMVHAAGQSTGAFGGIQGVIFRGEFQVVTGVEEGGEVVAPEIDGGDAFGTMVTNAAGEYVVSPAEGCWFVAIKNAGEHTLVIPPSLVAVVGVSTNQLKVKSGLHDITGAFTFEGDRDNGVTLALAKAGRVKIGDETIEVCPELTTMSSDKLPPISVGEEGAALGVKTIPGLKYVLLRGDDIESMKAVQADPYGVGVASRIAEDTRTQLQDPDPPADKAFYLIRVELPVTY